MEKEFILYEQALALKELGFDEPCFGCYDEKGVFGLTVMSIKQYYINIKEDTWNCSAPLYQQAFRWFREKYKINGHFWDCSTPAGPWCFTVKKLDANMYKSLFVCERCRFKTPEEAELECLKKLIEIVKEK